MSIRVYALSTELNISSKKLLELCQAEGLAAKSHASTLTESEAARLRARVQAESQPGEAAQPAEAAAAAPAAPQETFPPPLPPRADGAALSFAPKLSMRRRRPEQHGLQVAAKQEAAAPAPMPQSVPARRDGPAAEVEEPPVEAAPLGVVEPTGVAEAVAEAEAAPGVWPAEAVAPAEAAPEAVEAAKPAARPKKKPVSIDEFVIEVPKAIGRIEGIVPKEIPRRKERKKPKDREGPRKEAVPAHPQAAGMTSEVLAEASRKAREVARRTIREAHKQTPSLGGILAETNRPQSGRSATAGGRRRGVKGPAAPAGRAGATEGRAPEAEAVEPETKRIRRAGKGGSRERRRDVVELDKDLNVDVLGVSHLRLERGAVVRRPLVERRRKPRAERTKRGDEALAKGAVEIDEPITLKSFCAVLGVQASAVIARLMQRGVMATINETLETHLAGELALEFGVELKVKAEPDVEQALAVEMSRLDGDAGDGPRVPRAPVVVFMGHVDHGKTSLMDRIRQSHVAESEAGGITQHIGAYRVPLGERAVTFLDTPGHEAFTEMRSRGAHVTDVAVLVVAADDGVMPQTDEAISHARAAGVPIVVALNKVDKSEANIQRVLGQLAERELAPEEWAGKTIVVQTSATTGQGVDKLLESLSLEAELLELTANAGLRARGTVIEARMQEGLGPVMTLLVRDGTLRLGDIVLAGVSYGRVRAMRDDQGRPVEEAGPSMPVSVSGLASLPSAGDRFCVLDDLQKARELAERRARRSREKALAARKHITLEKLFEEIEARKVKVLNVIIKADVLGSVEVLRKSVGDLHHPEVKVAVLHSGVGAVNESDVLLADASDAVIIGFQVVTDEKARHLAEQKGVDIRLYSVIYEILGDLKKALEGMLAPERREQVVGHALVRQTFKVSRVGTVAGCYVTDGLIRRNSKVRVSRQGIVVHEGELDSLKRFKDDVREVGAGLECGMKIRGFDDLKVDDHIDAVETIELKRKFE